MRRKKLTFTQAIDEFQFHLEDLDRSVHTMRAYGEDLKSFAKWHKEDFDELPEIEFVSARDARLFKSNLLDKKRMPSTINRSLITLRLFYDWCIANKLAHDNPAENIRLVAQVEQEPRSLSEADIRKIEKVLKKIGKIRHYCIFVFLLNTGIRVGELCSLVVRDVLLKDDRNLVEIRKGKGTKRRIIPLNSEVVSILKIYFREVKKSKKIDLVNLPEHPLFFTNRGTPVSDVSIREMLKKYADIAGVEGVSPHVFRHTFAKALVDSGKPLTQVARLLGHSNINTTARYSVPTYDDSADAVENISWR